MSGFTFPPEISRLMLEMQVEARERCRKAVVADPVKHKATLEFPEGARLSSRYWGTIKSRGNIIRYCYTTERNLAGYFLCFRQTINVKRGEGKRDMFAASKRRLTVRDKSRQRYEAHKARLAKARGDQ